MYAIRSYYARSENPLLRILAGLVVLLHGLSELPHAAGQRVRVGPTGGGHPHAIEEELGIGEVFGRQRIVDVEPVLHGGQAAGRITSYNVCYTKLLR